MDHATGLLKQAIITNPDLKYLTQHVITGEQGFLYSVMITDNELGHVDAPQGTATFRAREGVDSEETGLCFFANQQIDRSPTGGCVAARVALAHAKGDLSVGEKRMYNSLVNRSHKALAGFVGSVFSVAEDQQSVDVRVEGYAFYTGYHSFVVESEDGLGIDGFSMKDISF
ncbi:uncharacterized protein N7483_006531 [Penicillium malachiteum]|uniref:uncharacterized protein n=1 Tax=Penicillium malachiteum TaxID=1324776 RepID=UPI002548C2FE|nr:uncharacterized protein N7483_006531 [Penicillium malachiteum]KAJ5725174.1 hypothetical protein N7483_006531 [Penicillium malachiteum]